MQVNASAPGESLKTVQWLAGYLGLSTAQVYHAIRYQDIPDECVVRIGRRIRIVPGKVRAWVESGDSATRL